MKTSDNASKQPFDATASTPDYRAPIAPALELPTFPTLDDILAHQEGTKAHPLVALSDMPTPPPQSIFQGLLGGRTELLVQDALDHPERYDEPMRNALAELGGKKPGELTAAQLQTLNRATLDFAAYRPKARPAPAAIPQSRTPPPKKPKLLEGGALEDGREPMVETAGGPMSAYWWVG